MRRAAAALLVVAAVLPATARGQGLADDEPVVGLSFRGRSRAYPLAAFGERPVLNDVIARQEIVLFHDPGQGTTAAWFSSVFGEPLEFSGNAVGTVADDLSTITRWDLATGHAVGGNLVGQRLIGLPLTATSWGRWRAAHEDTDAYPAAP